MVAEVGEEEDYFIYRLRRCANCWGRTSPKPVCYSVVGVIDAGVRWVSDGKEFSIEETACLAAGDEACLFRIWKTPLD